MPEQNKTISYISLIAFILVSILFIVSCAKAQPKQISAKQSNFQAAADYSKSKRGLSVLIIKNNKPVFEQYHNGHTAGTANFLASGTKSFSGAMLAAAIEDGLIKSFDERVSETITEWKNDEQRSKITLRQLLSLTSGIDGSPPGRPPGYAEAINFPSKYEAGTTFQYGSVPFQIFGEVMHRKLLPKKETVMDYLKRRILDPIGLDVSSWRMQNGDQPNLPSGAFLTTREWAKFGQLLINDGKLNGKQILRKNHIRELTKGSTANPNYGLTFWLNRSSDSNAKIAQTNSRGARLMRRFNIQSETDLISKKGLGDKLPKDIYVAAGAGKQRLYIIPSKDMVIVRQGRQSRFDDADFLSLLFFGEK
jgi:CubicO group peptidase (beta-lactamase class C family)